MSKDYVIERMQPASYRPETRRLADLTNSELVLLFKKRADAVAKELDGHSLWNSPFLVYWSKFMDLQDSLYEVMMEIQSRYPAREISDWSRTLPVIEPRAIR